MKFKLILILCLLVPLTGCKAMFGLAEMGIEATVRYVMHGMAKIIGNFLGDYWKNQEDVNEISVRKFTQYNEKTHVTETMIEVRSLSQQPINIQNFSINQGDCHSTLSNAKVFNLQSYGQSQNYRIHNCTFSMVRKVELDTALKHYSQKF